jgi:hypothetical protein
MTPPVSSNRTVATLWQPFGCVKRRPGIVGSGLADQLVGPEPASCQGVARLSGRPGLALPGEEPARRQIVDFATERGWELTAARPRQELQRVIGLLAQRKDTGR